MKIFISSFFKNKYYRAIIAFVFLLAMLAVYLLVSKKLQSEVEEYVAPPRALAEMACIKIFSGNVSKLSIRAGLIEFGIVDKKALDTAENMESLSYSVTPEDEFFRDCPDQLLNFHKLNYIMKSEPLLKN